MAEAAPAAPTQGASPQQPPSAKPAPSTQARAPGGQFDKGNTLPIERQAAQGEQQPKQETAEQRRIRLKLDESGPEEEYDERTLAGLARRGKQAAQLMTKAEARAREAERIRQEAEAKLLRLKADPFSVLRELGVDTQALSEQQILRALEEEKERQLPPEERALRQRAREADELKRKLEERDEADRQTKEAADVERYKDELAGLFTEVMAKTGLPKSSARAVMHRVAAVVQAADAHGEEASPDDAAFVVMEGLRQEQRAILQGMTVPELCDWLGPEMMLAIRKHDLQQYRQGRAGAAPPPPAKPAAPTQPHQPAQGRKGRWEFINSLVNGK